MRANIVSIRSAALATGAFAILAATGANAADVVYQEPPAPAPIMTPEPVASWAGPYFGLSAGYGFAGTINNATGGQISTSGWMFGGFAGYQGQTGRLVYGVEGDVGYNGNNGTNGVTSGRGGLEGSLRARLGVAPTDNLLIYGTAGVAASRVSITDGAGTASATGLGYTVGAGTDVLFTENVFGRVEYRFTDLAATGLNTGSGAQSPDHNNHRITVGMGIKF
jgi:outer membrane immunogenic protein